MSDARPDWADPGRSRVLWTEDDATVRCEGHETLSGAWRRLFGEDRPSGVRAVESWDAGDAVWYLYSGGRIAVSSMPGCDQVRRLLEG